MIAIKDNIVKAKITVEDFRIPIKDIPRDHIEYVEKTKNKEVIKVSGANTLL